MTQRAVSSADLSSAQAPSPSLSLLLRRCESSIIRQLQPALQEAGLAPETWRIMAVLLERPGLGMAMVAEAAVLPNASLTRHVDTLVALGMVVRRIDAGDRRRAVVALSPRGQVVARNLSAREHDLEAAIAVGLGQDKVRELIQELSLLPHAMD